MTDEILKLARECGASVEQWMTTVPRPFAVHFELEALAKFAAAIRDEERSECAKVCEETAGTMSMFANVKDAKMHNNAIAGCAAAIRARS
jgi:selenophosphate synthetase-related protein